MGNANNEKNQNNLSSNLFSDVVFLSSKGNLQKFTKIFYIELNLPTKPPPKCKSRSLESTFNLSKKFEKTSLKHPFYYIQKRLKPFGLFSTFPPSKKNIVLSTFEDSNSSMNQKICKEKFFKKHLP